jgi:phosphoglucosamine mutase
MLFGTDGIRGVINEDLTPELAFRVGNALGRIFPGEKILIGRDTRASGEMLESAIAAGLASAGKDVLLCGVIPTPAVALLSFKLKTVGVVISASHNPPQFNGIKIVQNGFKLPDEKEREIEEFLTSVKYVGYRDIGRIERFDKAFDIYVKEILTMFSGLDLSGVDLVVDVANGAAYKTTPYVLEKLGANVKVLSDYPDGFNINKGCGSTNLDFLSSKKEKGVVGFAHDGDADRVLFLDENNEEVHGDKILGMMALSMIGEGRLKTRKVVATVLSNLGLEEFLKKNGVELLRTKVGDRYVIEKMLKTGTSLGGERSGHVIFLDRSTTGDGLITALEVLRLLRKSGKQLKDLHSDIVDYPQVMINVEVRDKSVVSDPKVSEVVEKEKEEGFRIIVRPSGTEPLIRIMVEGKDEQKIREKAERIAQVVRKIDSERGSG